jgi:hypothetical protein
MRRFTRLTNAFSKKLANHVAAVSLYVAHFNLCRVHEALRITPAMAMGITDHVWHRRVGRRRYCRRYGASGIEIAVLSWLGVTSLYLAPASAGVFVSCPSLKPSVSELGQHPAGGSASRMKWRFVAALVLRAPVGAIIGLAFAFATRGGPYGFFPRIEGRGAEAAFWAFAGAGALTGGIAIWRLLQSK